MMKPDIQNNILMQAEQKLESQLTPQVRENFNKVIVAGMKVALDKGPDGILASLKQSQDPIKDCVVGALNIVGMLGMQSRGTMPIQAAVPAAMSLTIHALDFADKAGIIKVGMPELAKAGHIFGAMITKRFGITPQMMKTAAGNIQTLVKDPANMEKLHHASGVAPAPGADKAIPVDAQDIGAAQ